MSPHISPKKISPFTFNLAPGQERHIPTSGTLVYAYKASADFSLSIDEGDFFPFHEGLRVSVPTASNYDIINVRNDSDKPITGTLLLGYGSLSDYGRYAPVSASQGTPEKGAQGDKGDTGASAYEIAVANGFVGSESDWLASLIGTPGTPGAPGTPGSNPVGVLITDATGKASTTAQPFAGKDSIAIGDWARAAQTSGLEAVAIGKASRAESGGTAIGSSAVAQNWGTSLGNCAFANGNFSAAFGMQAQANAENSVAIGYCANVMGARSVAIGDQSYTDESNVFAVGNASDCRRIVNVAQGMNANDAVTMQQFWEKIDFLHQRIEQLEMRG